MFVQKWMVHTVTLILRLSFDLSDAWRCADAEEDAVSVRNFVAAAAALASGQRIAARACRDAVTPLETVAESNFFDYDRPLREPVALPPTTDWYTMNAWSTGTTASTASGQICDYIRRLNNE